VLPRADPPCGREPVTALDVDHDQEFRPAAGRNTCCPVGQLFTVDRAGNTFRPAPARCGWFVVRAFSVSGSPLAR